eukprot:CAMPEP_0174962168 /NCGR_PEP_ID=MMETSP0004_2-20121128/4640_1 /TAXON_ID=420556 /ORGANISM="Ochromonas sp., Strain CCMP1393" /LENGTH=367 /DNA_ID=CAMNT_0016210683 /DNA_START=60 /DNA_END=1163 /DNA_ORIENTATION=-
MKFLVIGMLLVATLIPSAHALIGINPMRGFRSPAEALHKLEEPVVALGNKLLNKPGAVKPVSSSKDDTSVVPTLPWSESVNPSRDMTYMSMFSHTLETLQKKGYEEVPLDDKFTSRVSDVKPARIGNMQFQNEHFRKIRMTYFDAGESVQVYNAVFYPQYYYDLPILGIDLISLGKNRVLNVIDCQPLHPTAEYSDAHIEHLTSIRNKYPDLQGTLSGKIYDDTSFFSKNMLFGRFGDESKVDSVVYPAYEEYFADYLKRMEGAVPNKSPEAMELVKARQSAYDVYSAEKDPAVGLFDAYFGKEWSASYVHDFLFSLSKSEEEQANMMATIGIPTVPAAVVAPTPVHKFKIDQNSGDVITKSTPGHR